MLLAATLGAFFAAVPRRLLRCFRRDRLRVLFVHLRKQATLKFRNGIFLSSRTEG